MNSYKLTLGGEERLLQFSKGAFLKHLGEIAEGFDVLDTTIFTDPGKSYKSVLLFVQAGFMANGYRISAEEVEKWVDELDTSEFTEIQYHAFAAITRQDVQELKNRTAQAMETLKN